MNKYIMNKYIMNKYITLNSFSIIIIFLIVSPIQQTKASDLTTIAQILPDAIPDFVYKWSK